MGACLVRLLTECMVSISPSIGAVFFPEVKGRSKFFHLWQKIALLANEVKLNVSKIAVGGLDSEMPVEFVWIRMQLGETVYEFVEGRFLSSSAFHAAPHPFDSAILALIANLVEIT